jgi:hypothetical protein
VILKILEEHIPHIIMLYMDDVGVKGPRDRYNDEEVLKLLNVRRFIIKHIRNLDKVLTNIKCAGGIISGEKLRFYVDGMKVISYVCNLNRRHP